MFNWDSVEIFTEGPSRLGKLALHVDEEGSGRESLSAAADPGHSQVDAPTERQVPASPHWKGSGEGGPPWLCNDLVLRGRVHSCTWAEGSHLQLPAGLHPQATTPNSLQSGHAAHRCGAAKTRNLLSHSCLGGKKKDARNAIQLPTCVFCLIGCLGRTGCFLALPAPLPTWSLTPVLDLVPRFPLPHRQPEACGSGDGHSPAPGRPVPPIRVSWFYRTF